MTEWLTSILPFLLPTGALGAIVAWLFKRDTLRAIADREKDDAHKAMYNNLKQSVDEIYSENKALRGQVRRLEDLVFRAARCRYYSVCPLRDGLLDYRNQLEGKLAEGGAVVGYPLAGQHRPRDSDDEPTGNTFGYGADDSLAEEPP